jgi:hypothetical protein
VAEPVPLVSGKPVYHDCDSDCTDWVDVSTVSEGYGTTFVPGSCKHSHTVPVKMITGKVLGLLCLCCDHFIPERRVASR